jgi:hypothetical protein
MALTGSFAVWTVGGLEQPLLAALIAWGTVLGSRLVESDDATPRDALWPGVLLGLACLTRPDSPLFVAVAAGGVVVLGRFRWPAWRNAGALVAIPLAFLAAQMAFRLIYYGDWLPNPAHSKIAFTSTRLKEGADYLCDGLLRLAGLVIPAVIAVIAAARVPAVRARVAYFLAPLIVWSGYVMIIGGDIFPGRRHLVVIVIFLALLASELWALIRNGLVAAVAIAIALAVLGWAQWYHDPEHRRAIDERWEWDGQVVGELLAGAFEDRDPLLAATAAGCIPYFSGLRSLDMLGLNDRFLGKHPPNSLGEGHLGHELGNGKYVLGREPDLVIFCNPAGGPRPCFRSGVEMMREPEFHRRYRLVPFEGVTPHPFRSLIWVRTDSPRIGVQRSDERIVYPGYLLATRGDAVARLDAKGRIGLQLKAHSRAIIRDLGLPPGDWRFQIDASGEPTITIQRRGDETPIARGRDSGTLTLPPAGPHAVSVLIEGNAHIRRLIFERT